MPLEPAQVPPSALRFRSFLERRAVVLALLLVAVASARIVSTYWTFSETSDEPAHIACGMEWLDRGVYRYEAQHPPLARVAAAIGPYLLGARAREATADIAAMYREGLRIYHERGRYDDTLAASRAGILPFFWIACFVVYAWTRRDWGRPTAVVALFFFTMLPPVLAHAGLATTDMALTAFVGAAFLAARLWAEKPDWRTAVVFGVCGALAVLSKFSSLPYFPAAAALSLAWIVGSGRLPAAGLARAAKERLPSFGIAVAVAILVVWAGYRFSFGPGPAPELFRGISEVIEHNSVGHRAYLFGEISQNGFLHFYFVVLAVKTPIPFLLFAAAGVFLAIRSRNSDPLAILPLAFSSAILLVALWSRINIGVRHILPVYIGLSIVAALAVTKVLESPIASWIRAAVGGLLAWLVIGPALAHPDYLAYFNELAGSHPENILVDSDLDWGQDLKRLQRRMQQAGAPVVTFTPLYWADYAKELPPHVRNDPRTPFTGWNAVSLTLWKVYRLNLNGPGKPWPDVLPPQEMVGKSIALWYFPASMGLPTPQNR